MSRIAFSLLFVGALFLAAWPLRAETADEVTYAVQRGDTLYTLAEKYLIDPASAVAVQRTNGIRDPRRIPVGRPLRIARSLLKFEPTPLRVRSFSGPVQVQSGGSQGIPTVGAIVPEGSVISTGGKGFISLVGTGNSRVSLPSNSRARIVGARRYLINDAIDIEVRILKGRGEVIAPKLKKDERFRIGTPVAVTAVRGTEFRVVYDDSAERGGTEVIEGVVEVTTGAESLSTPEGFGVSASAQGLGEVTRLLPAPELVQPGKIQTDATVDFSIAPIDDALAYRTQLARDAGFVEVVAESVDTGTQVTFDQLADGRFFVRSRGVAESGLEGLAETYSFRRKRVGVAGSVETSPLDDAFRFAWLPEGEGASYQGFQLWKAGAQATPLIDEVGLTGRGVLISNLEPGEYHWRVATFQIDEGDVIKVWAPAQKLTVSAP